MKEILNEWGRITISHHIGFLQKYGTQVDILKNGDIELQPYEGTIEDVTHRRNAVGLEPLDEYLKKVKDMYKVTPEHNYAPSK